MDLNALWESTIQPMLAQYGLKVIGAVAVLVIGFFVARIIRGSVRKGLTRAAIDATLIPFIGGIVYFGVLAFVVIAALSLVGIPVTSFIAVLGAAGLAIALAFQGTLSNLASGVMILTFRPFDVGDFVDVSGTSGTVREVGVFATTLATPDNVQITVPNSQVYDEVIKNYSANENRRIDLVVGVGYGDDLDLAMRTMMAVITADERVLEDPAPQVAVSEMGASSVDFVVRPWVKGSDYWATRFDLIKTLKEELDAAGLDIPYPQRDLHLFHENAPPAPSGEDAAA